ncbi:uncharacterized protein [Magallana gigas]|uniref:uncharacterized protein isoform X2 n=1 Tax=Magallana gigas TaxID=29159 RepID=UPI003342A4D0
MSSMEFPLNMAAGRSADNANKNYISCYSDVIKNLLSITNKSQQESKKRYKLVVLRPKHPGDKLMMPRPKHPGDPQQSGSKVATDHNRFLQQVETATPSNIGPLDTSHSYISKKIKTEDDSDWIGLNESPFLCTSTATDKTSIPHMTKTENDLANESFISQNIKTEDIITYSDLTGHNQSTASPALFTPIVSTVIKTENDVAATESIDKDVISDARLTGWNESEVNTSHSVNSQMLSGSKCSSTMINTENDFRIFGTSLADQHRIPYFSLEPSLSHVVQNEANLTITDSSLESSHMSLGNAHCQNDSLSRKKIYTSKQFSKDSPSTTIHTVSHCPVSPNPVKSWSDIKGVVDRTSSRKRHIAPQQSAPKETQSSVDVSKMVITTNGKQRHHPDCKRGQSERRERKKQLARKRYKEKIFIGPHIEKWNRVKEELNFSLNYELAGYLLKQYETWKKVSQQQPPSQTSSHPYTTRPEPDTKPEPDTSSTDTGEEESMDTVEEDEQYEKQQETFQYLPPSPVLSHSYMTKPESDTSSTLTGEEDEEYDEWEKSSQYLPSSDSGDEDEQYEKWKESSQQPSSASMSNHPYMTRHSLKKISQHLPSAQSSSVPNTTQPESHTSSTEDEDKQYAEWKKTYQHRPSSPVLSHPYTTKPEPDTSSTDTGDEESIDTVEEDEYKG